MARSDIKPALEFVLARLPGIGDDAPWLFARHETFRDLCEEYKTDFESAADLDPERVLLRNEFAALLLRLEGALLSYTREWGHSSARSISGARPDLPEADHQRRRVRRFEGEIHEELDPRV